MISRVLLERERPRIRSYIRAITRYARSIAREDVSAGPDIRRATLLRIAFHHGPFICAFGSPRWTDRRMGELS